MNNWIDELARSLREAPLTSTEMTQLLDAAGDVAHRVERKKTPLSTFVIGCAVCRKLTSGVDRTEALGGTLKELEALLPPQAPEKREVSQRLREICALHNWAALRRPRAAADVPATGRP